MLDFTNVTFLIPFMVDTPDRIFNINIILNYLNKNIKTNIIIVEQGNKKTNIDFNIFSNLKINHILYVNTGIFHKTKLYNLGLSQIKTENTVCLDSDVLIPIPQMVLAKQCLDEGIDYCFPFDSNYIEISKHLKNERNLFLETFNFEQYLSSICEYNLFYYKNMSPKTRHPGLIRNCPPGGCLFIKTSVYIDMGMENEEFYGYSPEDAERKHRLNILEYSNSPIQGHLYHLDHDSSHRRISDSSGKRLYNLLLNMNKEQIKNYYTDKQYAKQYGI